MTNLNFEPDKKYKVTNRGVGTTGYTIDELHVRRQFAPDSFKYISFAELEALSFIPGGKRLLKEYLVIEDEGVAQYLLEGTVEPEYFYSEKEVKRVMVQGTLDEFLDMLDFAPQGILRMIKDLSVSLPLNDVDKRNAILKKMQFDVDKAIKNKMASIKTDAERDAERDGIEIQSSPVQEDGSKRRRVALKPQEKEGGRRASLPTHNIVKESSSDE